MELSNINTDVSISMNNWDATQIGILISRKMQDNNNKVW